MILWLMEILRRFIVAVPLLKVKTYNQGMRTVFQNIMWVADVALNCIHNSNNFSHVSLCTECHAS